MKRKFTLSTVNSAYLVLVTIALIGLHVVLFGLSLSGDAVSNLIKSAVWNSPEKVDTKCLVELGLV